MRVETLKEAIREAERFLVLAKQVKTKVYNASDKNKKFAVVEDYTKESSACKRASMDLTRALSNMRKPQ